MTAHPTRHPLYAVWRAMLNRCHNPNNHNYAYYGGRGIEVCDQWRESVDAFAADMPPRPSMAHSIDRIDPDGNYEPGNVRWATRAEQNANRRPRTHCLRGHELTPANTVWGVVRGKPARYCRQCKNDTRRLRRARKGEAS